MQPVQQQHPPTNPGAPPIPPPKNKIDPNQIPAPVPIQMKDQERYLVEPFGTCVKEQPVPLASTHFRTIDQGNCNPRFMRSTLKHVPQSVDLLRDTKLPWGMTVQPLAALHPQDEPIIVADASNEGPVRCQRCKAYINPWCRFTDGGRKFICNLCGYDSIVPDDYFSALDMSGRRMDADQRLELQRGTIEFAVPQDYWTRQPTHLHLVFAIDVTWSSIRSGMLRVFCQTLKHVLYEAQLLDPHIRIAIVTFDTSLHFYNLNSKSEQIGMLVVPELEDAFVPLADGLFVDPQESRPLIEELLEQLPTYFEHTKTPSAAFYPAVKACLSSMTKTGGKICVLQSSLPAVGPNALKNRDDIKLYGTDKEKQLFTPQNPAYLALAKECVANGVCVDLWLFPMQAYLDVSTIGLLPALTGGDTHLFPDFDPRIHGDAFAHDLQHSLVREQGFHCALRLRCSNGVAVKDQLGNFDMSNATDLELGGTDADKSFAFELAYDDKLSADQDVYFQCALLYTTRDGHRRVRVHNLCLSVTTTVSGVFRHADLDTAMNLLAKRAVTNSMKKGLSAVTTELDNDCMMILTAYRKHCAASASPGQLILPESFKLLPLMTLGLKKTPALRKDLALKSDVRAHHMRRLKAMPVSETIQWFYPTMIQVDKWITMDPRQLGNVANVWPLERLSHMRLRPDGIYLIDADDARFLWIGQGVSTDLLQGVFGVDQLKDIPTNMSQISPQSHAFSERYQQLVAALDVRRPWQPQCAVIRQGIDLENEFIRVLGEDDTFGESNYVDYLCMIHKRIQAELEREKQDSFVTSASYWAYRY
ncbi:Sec23/Sec24 trunk domain-containing protein [Gongronella butleri]|nr:Sec23/Sec24 trunk domain-containing protein [Gongronella butleri]